MATFVQMVGQMVSKGNEAKSKMKHPVDMSIYTPIFKLRGPTWYQLDHGGGLVC